MGLIEYEQKYKYQICHYYLCCLLVYKSIMVFYTVYNKETKKIDNILLDNSQLREWCLDLFGTDSPEDYKELLVNKFYKLIQPKEKLEIVIQEKYNKQVLKPIKFKNLMNAKKEIEDIFNQIKEQAIRYLEENGIKSVDLGDYRFSYVPEGSVETIDKKQVNDDYLAFNKTVPVNISKRKASVRIVEKK